MKVLIVITNIDRSKGGPARSVPMLAKGLSEVGIDTTLLAFKSDDINLHALEGSSVNVQLISPKYKLKDLDMYICNGHFDIIHSQCIWSPLFHHAQVIARKYNIPFIITPRGTLEPWSLEQKKWKKKIAMFLYQMRDLKSATCIYTTAELEAKNVKKIGINVPMAVIPNGIEISDYDCRSSITDVAKQALFLSRIDPKKGLEILFESWKNIITNYPDWTLKVVGNGDTQYINKLKKTIIELGIDNTVEILPPAFGAQKNDLYYKSSLFVLPTHSENFGMVIAEAMSCGLPVITTNGTPWALINGNTTSMGVKGIKQTGWCIDLSVDNLSTVLSDAMSMSLEELFVMGKDASELIKDNFSYKTISNKNKQLYEWILGTAQKPNFVI